MNIQHTNINVPFTIESSGRKRYMNFYCQYLTGETYTEDTYTNSESIVEDNINIVYRGYSDKFIYRNDTLKWSQVKTTKESQTTSTSKFLRLYFPGEGTYTYSSATLFHINIYTFIDENDAKNPGKKISKKIILYSGVINSYNNLACAPIKYNSVFYQEYQDIHLIDVLDEYEDAINTYIINVTITPVYKQEDNYYTLDNSGSGSSFIALSPVAFIDIVNTLNNSDKKVETTFVSEHTSIESFMKSIYGDNAIVKLRYCLINRETEDIYINTLKDIEDDNSSILYNILLKDITWKEGMQVISFLEVYNNIVSEDTLLFSKPSSSISLTYDIFTKMLHDEDEEEYNLINKIEEMSTTINVKNTITKQTVQVNQQSDTVGNGIITPVFFRAYPLSEITLHRDMIENICINLDDYKNKIDTFYIKLCGNYFIEYARTYDGVVFNIDSSVITSNTGTYYICDENKEFITSGKYSCE